MALIDKLLAATRSQGASDLHMVAGSPPAMRVNGRLLPTSLPPFTKEDVSRIVGVFLSASTGARAKLNDEGQVDLAFEPDDGGRFRVNIYRTRNGLSCAVRAVPDAIASLGELGLPDDFGKLTSQPQGLILVTGPTGSGKSTTMAAFIDKINREQSTHIITFEDPIEFVHQPKKSLVSQREYGIDYHDTARAVRASLRQDPDVILVGEMRDTETMQAALTVAETGHLALATLHTTGATGTVTRIIDSFPPDKIRQVRIQLSFCLTAVVSQTLLPNKDGTGRVLATEYLRVTHAVRSLIREGKEHQLYSSIQSGGAQGMHTLNRSLAKLVKAGLLDPQVALEKSNRQDELRKHLSGQGEA